MNTLTHEMRRRRGLVAAVRSLLAAAAAVVVVFALPGAVQAATTITSNSTGTDNGYFYSFWEQSSGATMTLGSGGNYSLNWNTASQNVVAGKGWNPGNQANPVTYSGTWNCNGNCYLSLYGWFQNPLVEWYIVDNYGSYNPSSGATRLGSVSSDGSTYDLYKTIRVNAPSIEGNSSTFDQYWAVRQSKRTGGTITVANIFNAWKSLGLKMGTANYEILATEGYQSSGNSNITVNSGSSGGTTPPPSGGGGGCTVSVTAGDSWSDRYNLNVAVSGSSNWKVTAQVPSPEKVSATWNVNASYPDAQTLVATPNGNGNNWGLTIMKNGSTTWPTFSCSTS
ncbi:glycoside hydrolase family 11 protein [Streptomyces griseofuscus]|uniref:glycoside hydrolase family 11 protein n=1 Tax=Streptomyces TaxID=1883 RepID=UPI0018F0DF00|nr:glycoside hydrolase family 11 protein [Streptomyces sp. CRPSP2-6A1]MBJ6998599.1 glycoside hydrolase family 11 protein [Streptomyces sp. CRPSP2-6A1]